MTSKTRTKLLRQTFFKERKYVYLESYLKIHLLRKRSRWLAFSFCAGAGGRAELGASAGRGPRPRPPTWELASRAPHPAGRRQLPWGRSQPLGSPGPLGTCSLPRPRRASSGQHPRPAPARRLHFPCFEWQVAAKRVGDHPAPGTAARGGQMSGPPGPRPQSRAWNPGSSLHPFSVCCGSAWG